MENKEEDKLLISKVIDKIEFSKIKNKIENSNFLDIYQLNLIDKFLKSQKNKNHMFYGGFENAERKILLIYPDKLEEIIKNKQYDFNDVINIIRITLPKEMQREYTHRNYLGALMKLGIKREKVGDILVDNKGANIIVLSEITKFLLNSLPELTRFSKAKIEKVKIEDIRELEIQTEEVKIIVPSMRLDNIVSELARCSRNQANEIINQERVLINFEINTKISKEIKQQDVITIRGKGRFTIKQIIGNTKKDRIILNVEKFK